MKEKAYNRYDAIQYAKKWAYKRNPKYYDFTYLGGDCTSFVSQCLFAGSKVMNYKEYIGWYYNSVNDRAPSWSGVEYLYKFLINNKGVGPVAKISNNEEIVTGDIIQLKFEGMDNFSHSLFVVDKSKDEIYVATHTFDVYYKKLSEYIYEKIRFLHIEKIMTW